MERRNEKKKRKRKTVKSRSKADKEYKLFEQAFAESASEKSLFSSLVKHRDAFWDVSLSISRFQDLHLTSFTGRLASVENLSR